jgi:hypothetical protein
MRITRNRLRQIIREEAGRLGEQEGTRSSEFAPRLAAAVGRNHMGFDVQTTDASSIRFYTRSNGQALRVHAAPFFDAGNENIRVSVAVGGDIVRQGHIPFSGEQMVEELVAGDADKAAGMFTRAIDPVLEAAYGLAEIR